MKSRWFFLVFVIVLSFSILFAFFGLLTSFRQASAAPEALTVTSVSPNKTPNDLDTRLVITGTGFVDGASAQVGGMPLVEVAWVSAERLEAKLPWGMQPGIYALTVFNPGGESATLPDAVEGTQAFGAWTHASGCQGGTVSLVYINPITPTLLYAIPWSGGLFRSQDGGENWELSMDELVWSSGVGALALGADGQTVYAATPGWIVHLWRSDDNGVSWQPLVIPDTRGDVTIIPHPAHADTLFVITYTWDSGKGLFRSTDRGLNWMQVTEGISGTHPTALAIHPTQPLTMALGTESGEVYLSTDGGESWSLTSQTGLETIGGVNFHPTGSGEVWVHGADSGLKKSASPDLSSWITVEDNGEIFFDWMSNNLWFAPLSWGEPYSRTVIYNQIGPMRISYDGGLSWQDWGGSNSQLARFLVLHPTTPNTVYIGSQEGVELTEDFGSTWSVLDKGLTAIVPTDMAIVPGEPGTVYGVDTHGDSKIYELAEGGTYCNLLPLSIPGGLTSLALDPFNSERLYVTSNEDVYISTDGGQSWPISATLPIPDEYIDCWNNTNVIAPDPSTPGVILAGMRYECGGNWWSPAGGLYLSADYGESWMRLMAGEVISSVEDIAYDPGTPGIVYAGTNGSGVLRSTNGGLSWQPVNNGINLGDAYDVEVEPAPPYRLFLGQGGSVYVSEDQGEHWSYVQEPPAGISGYGKQPMHIAPGIPPVLYFATGSGLYSSVDGGDTWQRTPEPLGTAMVRWIASTRSGERTVLYTAGAGGMYRLSRLDVTLSGTVTDVETGLPVVGAQVQVNTGAATFSDLSGIYSLTLSTGVYTLTASADGYFAETVSGVELIANNVVQSITLTPAPPVEPWMQVNQNGFGSPDYQVTALEVFQPAGSAPHLYAGTWGVNDARVYRSSDGWNWELAGAEWVTPTAFIYDFEVFDGQLYAALDNPAQLWRTDGETWQAVDTVGFGDLNNAFLSALAVFDDYLYAATANDVTGIEVWRSSSGNPGTWIQVNQDGFGAIGSSSVVMEVLQGQLYVGFARDGTGELWRTSDGMTWETAFSCGLGKPENNHFGMAEYQGYIYVSFRNVATGGEVWRSSDGLDWELVFDHGLDDLNNTRPFGLIVADETLYIVISNVNGVQVWRSFDGEHWQRCNTDGWGDLSNTSADFIDKGAAIFNSNLYIGTYGHPEGGEIWRLQLAEQVDIPFVAK